MGGSSSKSKRHAEALKYGQVYVKTDKGVYFGGETVTGQIYVDLKMPFPGNKLMLTLKGKESTHVVRSVKSGDSHDESYTKHENVIIKHAVPIYTWSSIIPGQYTIPFAFALPENLPSSFHQEGYRYMANISYRLIPTLEPDDIKAHPRLKFKSNLVVRQPFNYNQTGAEVNGKQVTTNIKTCCWCCKCKHGANTLSVNFQKNWYAPGEVAHVTAKLDNGQCTMNNTAISFTLRQRLSVNKNRGIDEQRHELIKVESKVEGAKKGETRDNVSLALTLPAFQDGDYTRTKIDNMKSYLLNLGENNSVMSSATQSTYIQSEYFLEVNCPMDGSCCVTLPEIECPIQIYHPEVQVPVVMAPVGWNPTQLENVNVSFAPAVGMHAPSNNVNININMGNNNMGEIEIQPNQTQAYPQYGQNHYS